MQDTIGAKLIRLRQRSGLSLAAVAKGAGYAGPSSVQAYFHPDFDSPLQVSVAQRLADALADRGDPPINPSELFNLSNTRSSPQRSQEEIEDWRFSQKWRDQYPEPPALVPIYSKHVITGHAFRDSRGNSCEIETVHIDFSEASAFAELGDERKFSNHFIAFAFGFSMYPRFRTGDPLLVSEIRPPMIGDDVLVELKSGAEPGTETPGGVETLVKSLVRRTAAHLELEQFDPHCRFLVASAEVQSVRRIVPWHEVFDL